MSTNGTLRREQLLEWDIFRPNRRWLLSWSVKPRIDCWLASPLFLIMFWDCFSLLSSSSVQVCASAHTALPYEQRTTITLPNPSSSALNVLPPLVCVTFRAITCEILTQDMCSFAIAFSVFYIQQSLMLSSCGLSTDVHVAYNTGWPKKPQNNA